MPTKRAKFDWSTLDRNGLYHLLWQIRSKIVDQPLNSSQIKRILGKHITSNLPVKVTKRADAAVESGWIYIGGVYYSDLDKSRRISIEILLTYNPLDEFVKISKNRFSRMCKVFADVVLHEIIHMRQYRRRKFKIIPDYESNAEMQELRREQNYLGCSDEIDAYSFNIACELLDRFKFNRKEVIKYISKKHRKGHLKSSSLRSYLKAFEYDHNHPIIKRMKKRVIRYLPHAEFGKPYKNKDWINR